MKCQIAGIATLALVLGWGAGIAPAQNSTSSESLGDLARQLKAERAKSQEKSKVYTNDDLAALPSLPGRSTASPAAPSKSSKEAKPGEKPAAEESGKEAGKESAKAIQAKTAEETHGEKYYRDHMGELEDRLGIDQRELSVLEQKLGQNQMMYYPDPNRGLLQESGPTAMSDVHNLQDQITKKKAGIAADQEAIEALREQLRREGGDPAWLRNDNLPADKPDEGSPAASVAQSAPAAPPSDQAQAEGDSLQAARPTSQASEPGQAANQSEKQRDGIETKEYWQARFKSVRARLADAQERQQLAEDELNLLQIQEARALDHNVKTELAGKINAKENELSRKRAVTEGARKALDDLQKEFQASGAPEEWGEESGVTTQ